VKNKILQNSVNSTIDLSHANLFQSRWDPNAPSFPILQELGEGRIHRVIPSITAFDFSDLLSLISRKLIRSDMKVSESGSKKWSSALFRTHLGGFVQWSDDTLTVYSAKQEHAVRLARKLQRLLFKKTEKQFTPGYLLIKQIRGEVDSEFVSMKCAKPIPDEELSFFYGEAIVPWHGEFLKKFTAKKSGITIMEGPPGCGKTSYIKGLIATLARSHRFYFIPPHQVSILSEPEFIDFWSKERDKYNDLRLVLVIEDAEHVLESRANDNRTLVSTLLNYSDGLLSEFLKMQIICTINCSSTRVDQALLRPGRLLARRAFNRLTQEEASRIARRVGKTFGRDVDLQVDYSLAEIFNQAVEESERTNRIVGFAA
jgi:hypothetical protein